MLDQLAGHRLRQDPMFIQMLFLLFLFDTLYTAIATSIYVMSYEMAVSNKAVPHDYDHGKTETTLWAVSVYFR